MLAKYKGMHKPVHKQLSLFSFKIASFPRMTAECQCKEVSHVRLDECVMSVCRNLSQ